MVIDTGMGPVFAFCETGIKWTFIKEGSIGTGMSRRLDPGALLHVEVEGRLEVADSDQMLERRPADVGWKTAWKSDPALGVISIE
jgi:hypothetical protein